MELDYFMVDVTVGIKVLICPSEEQKDLFHKNFGCSRKAYNVLLGKYDKLYKKDNTLKPNYSFLSKLLNEIKKEFPYFFDVESTSLQQSARDLATGFSNFFKNPKHFNRPVFHKKEKLAPALDKQYQQIKKS